MQKRKVHPDPIVEHELFDDEELLWQGKPNPMRMMRKVEWAGVLFGLFFAAFAVFFIYNALDMFQPRSFTFGRNSGPPAGFQLMFMIVPIAFICIGLYQAAQPFLKFIEGKGTTYALTNKRALVIIQTWTKQVRSYYDENIRALQTRQNIDGTGDVIFSSRMETRWVKSGRRSYQKDFKVEEGFFGITDARDVEDLMSQLFFDEEAGVTKSKQKPQKKVYTPPKAPTAAQLEDRFGDRYTKTTIPKTSSKPEDISLSPQLIEELAKYVKAGHYDYDKAPKVSKRLHDEKLVTEHETGPGGRYTVIQVTPLGKKVLEAYGRDVT